MSRACRILAVVLLIAALSGPAIAAAHEPQPLLPAAPSVAAPQGDSSLLFVENAGQFSEGARFQVWGGRHTMWLAEDAIWITVLERPDTHARAELHERGEELPPFRDSRTAELSSRRNHGGTVHQPRRGANLRVSFPGANPHPRLEPFDRLDTRVSYFIGNDPDEWRPDVAVWAGVRYVDLYPGVDLEVHSENGQIVKRAVAQPGADLSAVRLRVEGAEGVALDSHGLRLHTAVGALTIPLLRFEGAPAGGAASVFSSAPGMWELQSPFFYALPAADRAARAGGASGLVYSTFLGGSGSDWGYAIAVDASGAAYVAGETWSPDFPTTPAPFDTTSNAPDAFVAKLNAEGSGLAYVTFLGGSSGDYGYAIAVDASGAAYVAGETDSTDLPTTPAAFDTTYNGGWADAFVAKLTPVGSGLAYATFLGGSYYDGGLAVAVHASGAAYVAGYTHSPDFPTTAAAFDTTLNGLPNDAFVVRLNPVGSGLAYATFLGGSGNDGGSAIAVDASGAAYVAGSTRSSDFPATPAAFDTILNGIYDAFVARLNPAGSGLAYATFLGGSSWDGGWAIAVDASGAAYVAGETSSHDFPTTPAAFDTTLDDGFHYDAFVAKLNPEGSGLAYGTFLGGSDREEGWAIAVDAAGAAHMAGWTQSSDFPATPAAFDTTFGGYSEAIVAKLSPSGSGLAYATFVGGTGADYGNAIAVDASGAAYVVGGTASSDFPTTPAAFDTTWNGYGDAFVAKLVANGQPTLGAITPSSGSGPAGITACFTTTWQDLDGWQDLKHGYFHIGATPSMVGNVTLMYNVAKDKLWLRGDDGLTWLGGCLPGTGRVMENSQAKVYCAQTTVQGSGDTVRVTWAIEFKPTFRGDKKLGLMCKDRSEARAKAQWKGTWTIE